jgi:hypothetical protein
MPDQPNKMLVLSYPKTGRTWLKALIGNYLVEKTFLVSQKDIFDTQKITRAAGLSEVQFTHAGAHFYLKEPAESYQLRTDPFESPKLILLSRDIKDTLVSAYHQVCYRGESGKVVTDMPWDTFLANEWWGLPKIITFYQQLAIACQEYSGEILDISYEGLHSHPVASLTRVLEFMGDSVDQAAAAQSVALSSFRAMRKLEEDHLYPGVLGPQYVRPLGNGKYEAYVEGAKTRRGEVGAYKDYLTDAQVELIDERVKRYLPDCRVT